MRLAKALFCAAALLALMVPGVRADDYNKLTYFTFSGTVQVPGATLPAGPVSPAVGGHRSAPG